MYVFVILFYYNIGTYLVQGWPKRTIANCSKHDLAFCLVDTSGEIVLTIILYQENIPLFNYSGSLAGAEGRWDTVSPKYRFVVSVAIMNLNS